MSHASLRDEMDSKYRATSLIADPQGVLDSFVAESEKFRATHSCLVDVKYGPSRDEIMDIFLPATVCADMPVHIFIHGGYWYQFGKNEWSFVSHGLTQEGCLVIVPKYSLCPKVGVGEILQQMRTLLIWCYRNVRMFGGSPDRISLSGHSAGGHLAMELVLTDWEGEYSAPWDLVKGVTSISGIYDLHPITQSYVQDYIALSDWDSERLSPLFKVRPSKVPMIMAMAGKDPSGFHEQGDEFARAWRNAGNSLQCIQLPDANHLTALHALSDRDGPLLQAIKGHITTP